MQRIWIAAAAMLTLVAAPGRGAEPPAQPMLGEKAPAFSLRDLGGKVVSLGDLRGKFVVIHFGASW